MSRETLLSIGARIGSGKWDAHSYLPIYDELFAPFRDEPITLVEFGIHHGNSMHLWLEYFTKARIIGVDNNPDYCRAANQIHPRITAHPLSQDNWEVSRIMETFDASIVISDAGHVHNEERTCFSLCWQHIKKGGLYIIEDIQTDEYRDYWRARGAQIYANYTSSRSNDFRYDDVLAVFRKE